MTVTVQELILKLNDFNDDATVKVGSSGVLYDIADVLIQEDANNVALEFIPQSDLVIDTSDDEDDQDEE
jgi:hypothetical protein